jgi:hypothetical protein
MSLSCDTIGWDNAFDQYARAYVDAPNDANLNLFMGIAVLQHSLHKLILGAERHAGIAKAFAFFFKSYRYIHCVPLCCILPNR